MARNILLRAAMMIGLAMGSLPCENRLDLLLHESIGGAPDLLTDVHEECNSDVGHFRSTHFHQYKHIINKSLQLALQYMPLSSNFGRDTVHRLGFQKLFREMSDKRFESAKKMIKYATKRGATLQDSIKVKIGASKLRLEALPSLGRALSDSKQLYLQLDALYRRAICIEVSADGACEHDPDLAHHLQDALQDEISRVNQLAISSNQLAAMFTTNERSLSEHVFDTHLLN